MLFYFLLKLDILSMETYGTETIYGRIKKTGKTFSLSKSELKVIFSPPGLNLIHVQEKNISHIMGLQSQ